MEHITQVKSGQGDHDEAVQSFIDSGLRYSDLDGEAKKGMYEAFLGCSKEMRLKFREHIIPLVKAKQEDEYTNIKSEIERHYNFARSSYRDYGVVNILRNDEFTTLVLGEETEAKGRPNDIGYTNIIYVYSHNKQLFDRALSNFQELKNKSDNPFS